MAETMQTEVGMALVETTQLSPPYDTDIYDRPLQWETRIEGGPRDGYCTRYTSWWLAAQGHAWALKLAQEAASATQG